ncbi:MAG: UvrD-helicase domain-containing protein, partial [Candidatus Neomarinimicrobiota bacterium]
MIKLTCMAAVTKDRELSVKNISEAQFVCAAAGTGKTSVLVERYLEILLSETAGIEQIVAITFTEKAANEMKERLRLALAQNRPGADPQKIARFIDRLNLAPISTVHSFCARILRDNVADLNFDPLFQICDETAERIIRTEFMQNFLEQKLAVRDPNLAALIRQVSLGELIELLDLIYEKQAECEPILQRYHNLNIAEYLAQTEKACFAYNLKILANFFNDPAVREILPQIATAQTGRSDDTLQKAFDTILTAEADVRQKKIPASLWDNSLRRALDGRKKGNAQIWGSRIEDYRTLQNQLKARFDPLKDTFIAFAPDTEEIQAEFLANFARFASEFLLSYRTELRRRACLDFTGLEIETEALLARRTPAVIQSVRRFKHLLVDEFQDINPIQYRIIRQLQEINPDMITFFVGDEKQSIYRFRGAEVEIFNTLRRQPLVRQLAINYRSGKALMDFYNFFFANFLGTDLPAERFAVHYPVPIQAHDDSVTPQTPVELILLDEDEEYSNLPRDNKIADEELEAQVVVGRIRTLHQTPVVRTAGGNRLAEYGDMTILLRSRTHQAKFETALQKAGIPYYVLTGIGFYDQPEIVDLINYLRVLLNWRDEPALVGVLRSPLVSLSDATLTNLSLSTGLCDGIDQFLQIKEPSAAIDPAEAARLRKFYNDYVELNRQLARSSTAEILDEIVRRTNCLPLLAGLPGGAQKIANVKKLIDRALEWEATENLTPIDFIRRIRIYRTQAVREGEANLASEKGDAVILMTIHAAKGLDFPIVFLPLLAGKINYKNERMLFHPEVSAAVALKAGDNDNYAFYYKYLRQIERRRTLAEEKRLMYVAMTRAKSYLVCTATPAAGANSDHENSLWDLSAEIFDLAAAENLCRIERRTKTEVFRLSGQSKVARSPKTAMLSEAELHRIQEQIQPVQIKPAVEKITATALADWVTTAEK